jgi:Tfp pilus assembly protein PilX
MESQHPMNTIVARTGPGLQRGAALIVGMIMLILLTLFALAAYKMGKGSLEIVGNMQQRNAVVAAANDTIQQALSSIAFADSPSSVFTSPCQGANTLCYDTNGDGKQDVVVTLAPPACIEAQQLLNAQIDITNSSQRYCLIGAQQGTAGIKGVPTNISLCSNSVWQLSATALDKTTLAQSTVTEGVAVRVPTATVTTSCPGSGTGSSGGGSSGSGS